jgi:hypothetical protein
LSHPFSGLALLFTGDFASPRRTGPYLSQEPTSSASPSRREHLKAVTIGRKGSLALLGSCKLGSGNIQVLAGLKGRSSCVPGWYGGSASKKIFLVLVLLALLTGTLTLRAAGQKTPKPKRKIKARVRPFRAGYRSRGRSGTRDQYNVRGTTASRSTYESRWSGQWSGPRCAERLVVGGVPSPAGPRLLPLGTPVEIAPTAACSDVDSCSLLFDLAHLRQRPLFFRHVF